MNRFEKFENEKNYHLIKHELTDLGESVLISFSKIGYLSSIKLCSQKYDYHKGHNAEITFGPHQKNIFKIIDIQSFTKKKKYGSLLIKIAIQEIARNTKIKEIIGDISKSDLKNSPFLLKFYKNFNFKFKKEKDSERENAGLITLVIKTTVHTTHEQ